MKIYKLFVLSFVFAVFLFSPAYAARSSVASASGGCHLDVILVNQDSYPAVPGDYVKLVFQISGVENSACKGAEFELVPKFPFTLEGSALRTLEGSTWTSDYKKEWMVTYKLKVSENAVEGGNEVEARYNSGLELDKAYITNKFNIAVANPRTEFDAVVQDISGSDVSIAIANVGKHTANSVVVRIPEQDNFRTTKTDGQMVGNLDSGDYTIVSFSLAKKLAPKTTEGGDRTFGGNFNDSSVLKFDIYYTDNIGVRRTTSMELPVKMGAASTSTQTGAPANFARLRNRSSWHWWYTLIIILVLAASTFVLCKKYPRQAKGFIKKIILAGKFKKVSVKSDDSVPTWLKNIEEKENKKI